MFLLAIRGMSRHRGRTALVATLIGLPVCIALVVGMLVRQDANSVRNDTYWADNANVEISLAMSTEPTQDLMATNEFDAYLGDRPRARIDASTVLIDVPGSELPTVMPVETFDPANDLWPTKYSIVDGVRPTEPGQIAISEHVRDIAAISTGDTIDVIGLSGPQLVTGIAHDAQWHGTNVVLAHPSQAPFASNVTGYSTWYLEQPLPEFEASGFNYNFALRDSTYDYQNVQFFTDPTVIVFLISVGLLCVTGLVASAAFATANRRRIHEFGMLSATGADSRQIKTAALVEAGLLGTIGAFSGAAIGLVGFSTIGRVILERTSNKDVVIALSALDVIVPIAVGIGAALIAAYIPARTVANVPTQTALAGRIPLRKPAAWTAPFGVGVGGLGLLLLAGAASMDRAGDTQTLLMIVAVVASIGGAALLGGPIVSWLAPLAKRLPITMRLVVRDSNRQRTRAAAAIGALTAMFIIPTVALVLIGTEQQSSNSSGSESSATNTQTLRFSTDGTDALSAAQLATLEREFPGASMVSWQQLLDGTNSGAAWGPYGHLSLGLWTTELAGAFAVDEAQIGADVQAIQMLPGEWGTDVFEEPYTIDQGLGADETFSSTSLKTKSFTSDLLSEPALFVFPDTATELSLTPGSGAGLLSLTTAPDEQQIARIHNLASISYSGLAAEAGLDLPRIDYYGYYGENFSSTNFDLIKNIVVGGAFIGSLIVLAVTAALVATESDSDLATMVAIGGAPRLRRGFLGRQTWFMASIAAAIALPFGLLGGRALVDPTYYGNYDFTVPWGHLALLLIGVPLAAAVIISLTMRSKPVAPLRRID